MPSRNLVLRRIGDRDLDLINHHLVATTFRAGQVLCEPGEEHQHVHFFTSGLVSAFAAFKDGEQIECVLIGRSGAVGALAAIGFRRALTLNICQLACHAWSIRVDALEEGVRQSPAIAKAMADCCEAQVSYGIRVGACNALHTLEQRLARWLLCASEVLERTEVCLSQEALAQTLGGQRSSVNPLLKSFEEAGILTVGRSKLHIIDKAALKHRACECHQFLSAALTLGG